MRLGEIGDNFSVNVAQLVADGDTVVALGTYTGIARTQESQPRSRWRTCGHSTMRNSFGSNSMLTPPRNAIFLPDCTSLAPLRSGGQPRQSVSC